ncbi:hypothetical protein BDW68DRAFT_26661 [Aspergillus falconensis]
MIKWQRAWQHQRQMSINYAQNSLNNHCTRCRCPFCVFVSTCCAAAMQQISNGWGWICVKVTFSNSGNASRMMTSRNENV